MRISSSNETPQYWIFSIEDRTLHDNETPDVSGDDYYYYPSSLVRQVTGSAGAMIGAWAREIEDINNDGVPELVISSPGGQSGLGNVGNVRILSGAALASSATAAAAVLQTIFNPDNTASNFGVYMEYSDITGDDVKDIVIGADEYDTATHQNAGAMYVFPMSTVATD